MRSAGLALSVVAVLAGVVVARLEYDRDAAERPSADPAAPSTRPSARPSTAGADEHAAAPPVDTAAPVSAIASPSEAARRQAKELNRLVAAQRFDKAAESGEALIESLRAAGVSPSDALFTSVRKLTAKARVFDVLVRNIDVPRPRPRASRVSLANGNTIDVVSARKESDHWVLELANGISYRPRLEEVLDVREMAEAEHREFVAGEWDRLRKRLRGIEDPIELYVRGVERCYRDGLESEGLELLEELLELPGSGKIPLRFGGTEAASATRDWEIAAGRAGVETRSETPGRGQPSPERTPRASMPGDVRAGSTPAATGANASPEEILERVRALRDEARALYRTAFKRETNTRELREARARLDRAFELLDSLEDSENVADLRRDLGQILSDVVRVSPF